jgi:hypothetical protein
MRKLYGSALHLRSQPSLSLSKGIVVGAVGGLAGTIVMDLFGFGVLLVNGGPDTISFSLIGDAAGTFFSRLGISIPGGTPLGLLLHYLIGLLLGITLGAGICLVGLQNIGWKKGVALGVLYVEAMSIPMLTVAAIVLQMTLSQTAVYFATSFIMHLVFGSVLGVAVSYGLGSRRVAGAPTGS